MEFDLAAQRLKRDQSKLKGRVGRLDISNKTKREVEQRKKEQERLALDRQRLKQQKEYIEKYYQQCEGVFS